MPQTTHITEIAANPPSLWGYHGKKQIAVMIAIGNAIHFIYGRHLPHFVRVRSTIEPMIGSLRASKIRAPSIRNATASALNPIASVIKTVKYEPMIVQMRFCPKPQRE